MIDLHDVHRAGMNGRKPAASCLLVLGLVVAGCAAPTTTDVFESNGPGEVGATQFAVTSVTRWADIEHDLQPSFQISEDQALQEVMPVALYSTSSQTNEARFGLSAGAFIGPPLKVAPSTTQSTTPAPAPQTVVNVDSAAESNASTKRPLGGKTGEGSRFNAGTLATRTDPSFLLDSAGGPKSTGPGSITQVQVSDKPIDIEPQLKYSLATSLLQYVKMTNHYVQDLVNKEDADAFVIRLQVTLMPLSRTAPYDTYTDIGFFACGPDQSTSLQVIPLLATDSLEGLMRSNSSSDLKDLALNLQAMAASASAGISAEQLAQTLRAVSGQDINSLMTMGRVTDNTVRVRLGAFAQPTGDFVMVPRTCTVPVVMLLKHTPHAAGAIRIRAVSKTVFVNAKTGKLLRKRINWVEALKLPSIRGAYWMLQRPFNFSDDDVFTLTELAVGGDYEHFSRMIRKAYKGVSEDEIGRLWLEALSLRATDPVQSMVFSLPRIENCQLPPEDQTATLYDDGVTTTVALRAGTSLTQMPLQGVLEVLPGASSSAAGATTAESPLRLYAIDDPAFSASGKSVVFLFPSLAASGVSAPARSTPLNVTLCLTSSPKSKSEPNSPPPAPKEIRYRVVSLSAEVGAGQEPTPATQPALPELPVDLSVAGQVISVAQTGVATVPVTITMSDGSSPYSFDVKGGTLKQVSDAGIVVISNGQAIIQKGGTCTLTLSNCTTALRFRVHDDRREKTFIFPVKVVQESTPGGAGGAQSQGGENVAPKPGGAGKKPKPTDTGN